MFFLEVFTSSLNYSTDIMTSFLGLGVHFLQNCLDIDTLSDLIKKEASRKYKKKVWCSRGKTHKVVMRATLRKLLGDEKINFFFLKKDWLYYCWSITCILEDDLVKNTNKFFSLCSTLGKAHKSHPIALKCLFFLKSVVVVFFCWFPRRIWKMLQIIPYLDRSAAWMKKIVAPPKATKLQSNDLKKKLYWDQSYKKITWREGRRPFQFYFLERLIGSMILYSSKTKQGNEVNFAISLLVFTNFKISLLSFHLFDGKKQTFL